MAVGNIKRLPRKRTATDSIPAPPIPPLLPPRPPEIPSASPRSDSMNIDGEENEEKMPPKMRKRWIHKNLDALKEIARRDVSPEPPSQSITAQPVEEVAMDAIEGCSDGQSRVIQAPLLNRMSIDSASHLLRNPLARTNHPPTQLSSTLARLTCRPHPCPLHWTPRPSRPYLPLVKPYHLSTLPVSLLQRTPT